MNNISKILTPFWNRIPFAIQRLVLLLPFIGLGIVLATAMVTGDAASVMSLSVIGFHLIVVIINPLNGLLVWLIGHPLTLPTINVNLERGIPDLSLARLVIGFLVLLLLAQVSIGKRTLKGIGWPEILWTLFVVATGVSMMGILKPADMFKTLLDLWLMPLVAYFIVKNLVNNRKQLDQALNGLLIIGGYSAIYMFYELLTGNLLLARESVGFQFYGDTSLRIVRGMYGTTLTFGLLFNWLLPIALHYYLNSTNLAKKALYALLIGLMLLGVVFTYKRTMWIALLVSLLLMYWVYPKFRAMFWGLAVVFTLVVGLNWGIVAQSEIYTERAVNVEEWNTANGRTARWEAGWALWQESPWLGHGYRQFDYKSEFNNIENDYLNILVSSGLVGFIPFIAFFVVILVTSFRLYKHSSYSSNLYGDHNYIVMFWASYITYFIAAYSGSGHNGHTMANYMFFTIMGVLIGSQTPLLTHTIAKPMTSPVTNSVVSMSNL